MAKHPSPRSRRLGLQSAFLIAICSLGSCASSHVIRWSQGRESLFEQPADSRAPYEYPASVLFSLPIAFVWDVGTWPFQWLWGVYPFGSAMAPEEDTGEEMPNPGRVSDKVMSEKPKAPKNGGGN